MKDKIVKSEFLDFEPMNKRRDAFNAKVREAMFEWVNPDGTPRDGHKVFAGSSKGNFYTNREPFRCLPCLFTGEQKHINLANALISRYSSTPPPIEYKAPSYEPGEDRALQFGIFQSNNAAAIYHKYRDKLTADAAAILKHHTNLVFEQCPGSAQIDFSFHGANDNMPAMSTVGLILGGEALNNERAIEHGIWKMKRFQRILSRTAWCAEYNSGTYSGITLSSFAKLASESGIPEVRELALEIEERLWAEMLLHWHPGTLCQAGPSSRAYAVDQVNHMHNQQAIMWMAFGPEIIKKDLFKTCFEHDGIELIHFNGYKPSNIAEYVELLDTELHVPVKLAELVTKRSYPAKLQGRVEQMSTPMNGGGSGQCHTTTYMEKSFSLGTVDGQFCDGVQTNSLYATYRRKPQIESSKDSGVLLAKYLVNDPELPPISEDFRFIDGEKPIYGEPFVKSYANMLTMQKDGTAMMLTQAHSKGGNFMVGTKNKDAVSSLKLSLMLPTHYGNSKAIIVGDKKLSDFNYKSKDSQPISIDTGGVYIHIDPLIASDFEREFAIEIVQENRYETINLINYRGPERTFTDAELARMFNGCVVTLKSYDDYSSLEDFHETMSKVRIQDYWAHLRYVVFEREDVELEMITSIEPMTIQTAAVDGRTPDQPMFASNQIDVNELPFVTGSVPRNEPFFPWKSLSVHPYNNSWGVGNKGI